MTTRTKIIISAVSVSLLLLLIGLILYVTTSKKSPGLNGGPQVLIGGTSTSTSTSTSTPLTPTPPVNFSSYLWTTPALLDQNTKVNFKVNDDGSLSFMMNDIESSRGTLNGYVWSITIGGHGQATFYSDFKTLTWGNKTWTVKQ